MKSAQFLNEEHDDHEASMAKAELLQIAKNAMETYKMFQDGDELPGWVSSKLTIANDHLNSVHEHMAYRTVAETASSGASRCSIWLKQTLLAFEVAKFGYVTDTCRKKSCIVCR